jgi:hypothetical protein
MKWAVDAAAQDHVYHAQASHCMLGRAQAWSGWLVRRACHATLESCYPATEKLTCVRRQGIGRSFVIAVGED